MKGVWGRGQRAGMLAEEGKEQITVKSVCVCSLGKDRLKALAAVVDSFVCK